MPVGTAEEYAAARAAETADIELRDPGVGEYNMHRTVGIICREAAEFEGFREEHAGLEAELATRATMIEIRRRAAQPFKDLARRIGHRLMAAAEAIGAPYAEIYGDSQSTPPSTWGLPF